MSNIKNSIAQNKEQIKQNDTKKWVITTVIAIAILAVTIFQYLSFEKFTKQTSRAYLVITDPVKVDTINVWGDTIKIVIFNVTNTGQTPAKNAGDSLYFEWRGKKHGARKPVSGRDSSLWVYGPGKTKRIKSFNQISNISNYKEPRLFFSGRIDYIDIFDERHSTEFCYEWNAYVQALLPCIDNSNKIDDKKQENPR